MLWHSISQTPKDRIYLISMLPNVVTLVFRFRIWKSWVVFFYILLPCLVQIKIFECFWVWCRYLRILFMNLAEFKAANLFVVWSNHFGILHLHLVDFKVTEYVWDPSSYFRYFATIFCWTQSCHQNDNIFFRLIRYSSYYHISSSATNSGA